MNKLTSYIICLVASLVFLGCKDENPPPAPRTGTDWTVSDQTGLQLARNISLKLAGTEYRRRLKSKLLEKFDGDFNVLWSVMEPGGFDPLLQLAMPSFSDRTAADWDIYTETPIVVYRPPEADLNKLSTLPAYRNGEPFNLDITREPGVPLLVISHNERVLVALKHRKPGILAGRGCLISPVLSDETYDYYLKQDAYDCIYSWAGNTGSSEGTGCERDQAGLQDHLVRARFATIDIMRQAEHYLDGNPEVFFFVTLASKNPSGFSSLRKSYPSADRSEWKDCGLFRCDTEWYDKKLPVFYWDPTLFGDLVRYDWFEEDYSKAKIELTLGLSTKILDVNVSGGVKITINEKDFFLDQDFVGYCDNANGLGTTYNTGKFLFTVNHQ